MTKKQAEIVYKWAENAFVEDELECTDMFELMQKLFHMMESDEPMNEAELKWLEEFGWNMNSMGHLEAYTRDQLFRFLLHEVVDTASPIKIERMIDLAEKTDEELDEPITKPEEPTSYPTEPEAIYTGGGFWLAASCTEPSVYAVIGSENEIPGLCYYRKDGDVDEYECNQMIKEVYLDNMTEDELKLYQKLYTTLRTAINNDCEIRH